MNRSSKLPYPSRLEGWLNVFGEYIFIFRLWSIPNDLQKTIVRIGIFFQGCRKSNAICEISFVCSSGTPSYGLCSCHVVLHFESTLVEIFFLWVFKKARRFVLRISMKYALFNSNWLYTVVISRIRVGIIVCCWKNCGNYISHVTKGQSNGITSYDLINSYSLLSSTFFEKELPSWLVACHMRWNC